MELVTRINKLSTFSVSCFLIAIIKVWFISKNEIITLPYDSENYISFALNGLWELGYMHSGYPIWLSLTHLTGLPQRITIEILYLLSCYFVVASIRWHSNYIYYSIFFAILAFAPFTFFLFDQALSDGFYLCLTLFALGFSLKLLSPSQLNIKTILVNSLGLGLVLGFMLITRAEDQLIYFWIFTVTMLFVFFCNMKKINILNINFWKKPFYIFIVTSITSIFILNLLCTIIYINSGVHARSYALLPGHYALLKNLSIIDTGISQERYVPISHLSRKLAYEQSPAFNLLHDKIEDLNNIHQSTSRSVGLPSGEIGAGWIWGAILSAMSNSISSPTPKNINDEFIKINGEIDAAFEEGKLNRRFVIHPLMGGDVPQLISDLPSGILSVLGKLYKSYTYKTDQASNSKIFDEVCNRRSALTGTSTPIIVQGIDLVEIETSISDETEEIINYVVLQGWAYVAESDFKISTVSSLTADGKFGETVYIERFDVSESISKTTNWKPDVYGFRTKIESNSTDSVALKYVLDNGAIINNTVFVPGQVTEIDSTYIRSGIRHDLQVVLVSYFNSQYFLKLASLILAFILVFTLFVVKTKKFEIYRNMLVIQILLIILFSSRILFYSLIETASWQVEIRYLASSQAVFIIFIIFSVLSIYMILKEHVFRRNLTR